jgi:hypothetical protein
MFLRRQQDCCNVCNVEGNLKGHFKQLSNSEWTDFKERKKEKQNLESLCQYQYQCTEACKPFELKRNKAKGTLS